MIKNDRQLGAPFGLFSNTKANIEALTGLTGGETAYATDTGEDGVYDAVAEEWVWGRSGGGGGGTPAGNDREIQFNDDGDFGASSDLKLTANDALVLGTPSPHITIPPLSIAQGRSGGSSFHYQFTFGDETFYSRLVGYHARGTLETSAASELNDILMAIVGRGYWAQDSPNPNGAELRIVATENHEDGKHGTAFELWVIPNESTTRVKIATIDEDGINLESGKTYRIDGVPIGGGTSDGWTLYTAVVPTRTASDDPTYTLQFAGVDLTGTLCEGMPIKWTQNSIVRYGWISSAPAFSTNTTITVLTICNDVSGDYDVLDTGTYPITNFAYGLPKQPGFGMPIDPEAWTIEVTDSTGRTQSTPTQNQWYNLGTTNCQIVGHIGRWSVEYMVSPYVAKANTNNVAAWATLSTANNTESDPRMTGYVYNQGAATSGGASIVVSAPIYRRKSLTLTAKTTLYLNGKTSTASTATLGFDNSAVPMVLRLTSAYL